jgi:hypothetical protein
MPMDLHFICKDGDGLRQISDKVFETGEWVTSDAVAQEAIGGRIHLHRTQKNPAWHCGKITWWHYSEGGERKIFTYEHDGSAEGVVCTENWGQEQAIIRRKD